MALSKENIEFLNDYLQENHPDRFEIIDNFYLNGTNGFTIREINYPANFFAFLGTSRIEKIDFYPHFFNEGGKFGSTEFDIYFQIMVEWIEKLDNI